MNSKGTDCEIIHASYALKGRMVYSDNVQENQINQNGIYKNRIT